MLYYRSIRAEIGASGRVERKSAMQYHINESEFRFMEILWEEEPVNSTDLVRICRERLEWQKSTTYTVIRKLCGKQIVSNEASVVRALVSREHIQKQESKEFLDRKFGGSLPSFITAYLQDRRLTKEEAERIRRLIEDASED